MKPRRTSRPSHAFTLIEVLLAVGLATALLVIALVFYRETANLRTQILQSSENLGAVRLTLDRLVADLRTATPHPAVSFVGGPSTLEFARLTPQGFPPVASRIAISTPMAQDGTNLVVRGLQRTETSLVPGPAVRPASPFASASIGVTNTGVGGAVIPPPAPPLVEAIRFLHLRFWNGAAWQDSWLAQVPPPAVEINIGTDPLPEDATPEAYPFELFRRVVLIPAGRSPDPALGTNAEPASITPGAEF